MCTEEGPRGQELLAEAVQGAERGRGGWARRGTGMKVEAVGSQPHVVTRETATNIHFGPGGSPVPGPLSTHEPFLCSCTRRN